MSENVGNSSLNKIAIGFYSWLMLETLLGILAKNYYNLTQEIIPTGGNAFFGWITLIIWGIASIFLLLTPLLLDRGQRSLVAYTISFAILLDAISYLIRGLSLSASYGFSSMPFIYNTAGASCMLVVGILALLLGKKYREGVDYKLVMLSAVLLLVSPILFVMSQGFSINTLDSLFAFLIAISKMSTFDIILASLGGIFAPIILIFILIIAIEFQRGGDFENNPIIGSLSLLAVLLAVFGLVYSSWLLTPTLMNYLITNVYYMPNGSWYNLDFLPTVNGMLIALSGIMIIFGLFMTPTPVITAEEAIPTEELKEVELALPRATPEQEKRETEKEEKEKGEEEELGLEFEEFDLEGI